MHTIELRTSRLTMIVMSRQVRDVTAAIKAAAELHGFETMEFDDQSTQEHVLAISGDEERIEAFRIKSQVMVREALNLLPDGRVKPV